MSVFAADTLPRGPSGELTIGDLNDILAATGDHVLDPYRPWRIAERAHEEWEQWGLGAEAYQAQEAAAAFGIEV